MVTVGGEGDKRGDERGNERVPDWVLEKTRPIAKRHRANTTEAYRAGVPIAAGTDAGTPFNPHGNLPKELALLAEVGLSPLDVLRAATTVAADALHLAGQVGTLQPGAFCRPGRVGRGPARGYKRLYLPASRCL